MRVRTHVNPLNFHETLTPPDWHTVFQNPTARYDFEIGFGRGVFLRHYAKNHPERNIIGVEVRAPLVETLKTRLDALNIRNAHLIYGSAELCIRDILLDNSLDNVFVFHPDPWFKKRHHKRRVINPEFLKRIYPKLADSGKLWISTDVADLYEAMRESLEAASALYQPIDGQSFWETEYTSHWTEFSHVDNRHVRYMAVQKR